MIEELLKKYTIPELRILVLDIEKECIAKQSELQMMVGSKYHDFIQSADHISNMKRKSEVLETELPGFGDICSQVLLNTKDLLASSLSKKDNKESSSAQYLIPNSQTIWKYLDKSDIYNAALTMGIVEFLWHSSQSDGDVKTLTNLVFLTYVKPSYTPYNILSHTNKLSLLSASYMRKTVLGDCRMLLMEGSCDPMKKCQALTALALFSQLETSSTDKPLNPLCLVCLDLLLSIATKQIRLAAKDLGSEGASVTKTTNILIAIVRILQLTLMDISSLILPQPAADGTGYAPSPIIHCLGGFLSTLREHLTSYFPEGLQIGSEPPPDFVSQLSARLAVDAQQIRRHVGQWVASLEKFLSGRCVRALEQLGLSPAIDGQQSTDSVSEDRSGAAAVARLQQQVWKACCQPFSSAILTGGSDSLGIRSGLAHYDSRAWEKASTALLAEDFQARKRKLKGKDKVGADDANAKSNGGTSRAQAGDMSTNTVASTLLWSAVFRSPFVSQVERLLAFSRSSVLSSFRSSVSSALAAGGLVLDTSETRTVSVKFFNPLPEGTPERFLQSSNVLFSRSEAIRRELEIRLRVMIEDVVLPVGEEGGGSEAVEGELDPYATTSLMRATRIQICNLLGQVSIFLKASMTAMENRLNNILQESDGSELSAEYFALLSGVLLIGRINWLLELRGRFLDDLLGSHGSKKGSQAEAVGEQGRGRSLLSADSGYISQEQLRSAFEIVDTDGDGLVSFQEALEALEAVSTIDDSTALEVVTLMTSKDTVMSPLHFPEFALVCCSLLAPDQINVVGWLRSVVKYNYEKSLRVWSHCVIQPLLKSAQENIMEEYGMNPSKTSKSCEGNQAPFRQRWRRVDMENLPQDAKSNSFQDFEAPASFTETLRSTLFKIHRRTVWCLASADTMQRPVAGMVSFNSTDSNHFTSESRSSQKVDTSLYGTATFVILGALANSIASIYDILLNKLRAGPSVGFRVTSSAKNSSVPLDQTALQVLLDLRFFDRIEMKPWTPSLHDIEGTSAVSGHKLESVREAWLDCADAVDYQLTSDTSLRSAIQELAGSRMLLPILGNMPAIASNPEDRGTIASTVPEDIFPFLLSKSTISRCSLLALPFGLQAVSSGLDRISKSNGLNDTNSDKPSDDISNHVGESVQQPKVGGKAIGGLGLQLGAISMGMGMGGLNIEANIRSNLSGLGGTLGGLSSFLNTSSSQQQS